MAGQKPGQERRTYIKRIYGEGEAKKFWVDVEVIGDATLDGAQFPGLDYGNMPLRTELTLDNRRNRASADERENTGRAKSDTKITMTVKGSGGGEDGPVVTLKATDTIHFSSKGGGRVRRTFVNGRLGKGKGGEKPTSERINSTVRIQCNNIDEEFLKEDPDDKGSKKKTLPPSNARDYKKAVKDSDDEQSIYLDVNIVTRWKSFRGRTTQYQDIGFNKLWGDAVSVDLPGAKPSTGKDVEAAVLDPYQSIINFGPDTLAVEFEASKPPGLDPGGPQLPGDVGPDVPVGPVPAPPP